MALRQLTVLNCRLMFANGLTERSTAKEDPSKPHNGAKYNAKFVIPKDDPQVKKITALFEEMAAEQWKDKGVKILQNLLTDKAFAMRDGDKVSSKGFENSYYFAPTNDKEIEEKGGIIFLPAHSNSITDRITDKAAIKKMFYSGCRVNLMVNLYTKDDGLFAFLKTVQFWQNDESLEGGETDTSALPTNTYAAVTDTGDFGFGGA